VLQSLVRALQDLGKRPSETVLVSGIGCSGRLPYFVDAYGFHTLHGRALPAALGVKTANPDLTVIVVGGDGDGFGIGGGHVPHIARRNVDITYLLLDNGVYALTKGHSSPTTVVGQKTPSAGRGEASRPLDIIGMLLAYRAGFIAAAHSTDRPALTSIIKEAILHPGFAAVHIYSPCPTYNELMTPDALRDAIRLLPEDHPRHDFRAALNAHYSSDGFLGGIIYQEAGMTLPPRSTVTEEESKARFMEFVARHV
jgi:2-oxoglutarate ferredoxin oxidoreductase subunit beta